MSDVPTAPAEFFTEYLPGQFKEGLGDAQSGPGAICFEVLDEGQWSLWIDSGDIKTQDGRHDDTLVQISIPKDDWADAAKRISEGGIGPMGGGGGASMLTNPAAATTLKAAQGTLKFVIKRDDVDHWMAITFGGADPNVDAPRATLSMTQEVAEQLGSGNANPQELFMAGKIQIAGDMMMLMQLAPIMS